MTMTNDTKKNYQNIKQKTKQTKYKIINMPKGLLTNMFIYFYAIANRIMMTNAITIATLTDRPPPSSKTVGTIGT